MADSRKSREKGTSLPPRAGDPLGQTIRTGGQQTIRMPAVALEDPPPPSSHEAPPATTPRAAGKSIELLVVDETQLPRDGSAWRAAEVWTQNRIYALDSTMRCFEIIDRETGRPEVGHDILGARLGGGRMRSRDTARFSYPLPLPGMEAMFTKGKKHGYTSPVQRMVLRVRVLHTAADDTPPTWEEIASRWSEPPSR